MRRLFASLVMTMALLAGSVLAAEFRVGNLSVEQPWARATPGAARTGVAYLTFRNRGGSRDRLVAVTTPVARRAALHGSRMRGDVMEMHHVTAIDLGPGEG